MDEDVKLKLRLISVVQKTHGGVKTKKTKTNKNLAAVQQDGCMFPENYL